MLPSELSRRQPHEAVTVARLRSLGFIVVVVEPSNKPGVTTPDILIDGEPWEIKCPTGAGKRTIDNNLREAARQCPRVVLDLHRYPLSEKDAIATARLRLGVRGLDTVLVLRKDGSTVRLARE